MFSVEMTRKKPSGRGLCGVLLDQGYFYKYVELFHYFLIGVIFIAPFMCIFKLAVLSIGSKINSL